MKNHTNLAILCTSLTLLSQSWGGDYGTLIFSDSFDRSESQELKDEPGNEWTTSSDKTAKGHKQVDLRDGTIYIYTHAEANHATSFRHAFDFRNGTIGMRFKLEDEEDSLRINIADMELKSVWAGHLVMVAVSNADVEINDRKTGDMDLQLREARKDNALTEAQRQLLARTKASFPHELRTKEWHQVYVTIEGDQLSCTIDGKTVGSLRSEGFAHSTKRLLRILAPHTLYVDDVKIWRSK